MRNIKTLIVIGFFALLCIKSNAQQAQLSDYYATWTGTGSDGNSYTMILNSGWGATFKDASGSLGVMGFKLRVDKAGLVEYDGRDHTKLYLVTNIQSTGGSNQGSLNPSELKTFVADVYFDSTLATLYMNVEINGSPVDIRFVK